LEVGSCKIIQFLRNAGNAGADLLHFVLHTEPLLPEAAEAKRDIFPEFSLKDFESKCILEARMSTMLILLLCVDTDLTFSVGKIVIFKIIT
jgi:hypothetical protein